VLFTRPATICVSNKIFPVSRSLSRTRQGCSASGRKTRQPSLKSKRTPSGADCVGVSAAGGYARFGAEPELEVADAAGLVGGVSGGGAGRTTATLIHRPPPRYCGLQRLINKVMSEPHQPGLRAGSRRAEPTTSGQHTTPSLKSTQLHGRGRTIRTEMSQTGASIRQTIWGAISLAWSGSRRSAWPERGRRSRISFYPSTGGRQFCRFTMGMELSPSPEEGDGFCR
jgi:hypothetical protein